MRQDRPGDRRGGRVPAARVHQHPDLIGREHLQRAGLGRLGERVRVGPQVQRPADAMAGPVVADRLGGGQDVVLVERRGERRPAVPGGPERDALPDVAGIGVHRVVRGDQLGDVHQVTSGRGLPRARIGHAAILAHPAPALASRLRQTVTSR
jgi:hypothetical protein